MAHDGSSFEDEHEDGADAPSSGGATHDRPSSGGRPGMPAAGDDDLAVREPYLLAVLARFEAGQLRPYDYTRRVLAINATSSTLQMEAIVEQPPEGSGHAVGPQERGLDPVDLALLRARPSSADRSPTTRYVTLAVVFVMFAVLIGVGMWLASHVHDAALPAFGIGRGTSGFAAPW